MLPTRRDAQLSGLNPISSIPCSQRAKPHVSNACQRSPPTLVSPGIYFKVALWQISRLARLGFALLPLTPLWSSPAAAGQTIGRVTFTKDVAPLVYRHCASCHRPGEAAPFSLLTYDNVRRRAHQIEEVTRSRYMPPWKAATGFGGPFDGERRLTGEEITTLA